MNVIAWIIFGLIIGVIASAIEPSRGSRGIVATTVLGILGALIGGFLGNLIFGVEVSGFNLPSLIISVIGAILLVVILRAFRRVY